MHRAMLHGTFELVPKLPLHDFSLDHRKDFVLQELEQWCQAPNVDWMVVEKGNNI